METFRRERFEIASEIKVQMIENVQGSEKLGPDKKEVLERRYTRKGNFIAWTKFHLKNNFVVAEIMIFINMTKKFVACVNNNRNIWKR